MFLFFLYACPQQQGSWLLIYVHWIVRTLKIPVDLVFLQIHYMFLFIYVSLINNKEVVLRNHYIPQISMNSYFMNIDSEYLKSNNLLLQISMNSHFMNIDNDNVIDNDSEYMYMYLKSNNSLFTCMNTLGFPVSKFCPHKLENI